MRFMNARVTAIVLANLARLNTFLHDQEPAPETLSIANDRVHPGTLRRPELPRLPCICRQRLLDHHHVPLSTAASVGSVWAMWRLR